MQKIQEAIINILKRKERININNVRTELTKLHYDHASINDNDLSNEIANYLTDIALDRMIRHKRIVIDHE